MKIRLLHILGQGLGGAERLVLDLTRSLDPKKYETTIIILGRGGAVTDLIDHKIIRVVEFGCRSGHDILGLQAVYRFLFSNQFDIVHNHQRAILTNVALLAMRPRPALVYHEHGMTLINGSLKDKLFYLAFGRFYDLFIAIHKDMTHYMVRAAKVSAKKMIVIENAVDIDLFIPYSGMENKSISSTNHPIIGTVARLIPEKDLGLFIETARLILRRQPSVHFVIVGDGPMRAKLETISDDPEFKGKLTIAGPTSDVPRVLKTFALYLFTSRIEAFGMTLLESLSCGVPVIAALPVAGGARGLLATLPGVSLILQREPKALANAAIDLLENQIFLHSLGQAGREHVVKNYALENWVKTFDNLYQSLLFTEPNAT